MQARYYDPEVARFISIDPVSISAGDDFKTNRYAYVNNNPIMHIDPTGRDCTLNSNGTFQCTPTIDGKPLSQLPQTPPLPAPKNWPRNMNSSAENHHTYIYSSPIGSRSENSVRDSIVNDPTPNDSDSPATPQGTSNSAEPSNGFRHNLAEAARHTGVGDSSVKTYSFKDSNGNTWVMNVTQDSHSLSPGYVLRGVVQGDIISYGEGTGALQNMGRVSDILINDVFDGQNKRNLDNAK